MNKIKKVLIDLGQLVALFMMLWPFVVIITEKNWNSDAWFVFICSILYDIYMYNIIIENSNN